MIDEETLAQMNGKYVCPPDAGPAWRAAMEYGFDMSLIEESLKLTPEQRLAEHQQVIDFLIKLQESNHAVGREKDLEAVRLLRAVKERKEQQKDLF